MCSLMKTFRREEKNASLTTSRVRMATKKQSFPYMKRKNSLSANFSYEISYPFFVSTKRLKRQWFSGLRCV